MRNIVPRIPGVNTLGTPAKRWGAIYADQIVLPDNKTLLEILSGQDTTIEEVLGQQNLAIANALAAQDTEISNRLGAQDAEIDSRLAAQDALLDEKVDKTEAENTYLKLSGGTMSGGVAITSGSITDAFTHTHNTSGLKIAYGVGSQGRDCGIYDITNDNWVLGYNSETGNIYTSDGAFNIIVAQGAGYIRYSNGVQICWSDGAVNFTVNYASTSGMYRATINNPFTFPVAFNRAPAVFATVENSTTSGIYYASVEFIQRDGQKINAISLMRMSGGSNVLSPVAYFAIGTWK